MPAQLCPLRHFTKLSCRFLASSKDTSYLIAPNHILHVWLQDAKLSRLEASLQQREEQIENHHAQRITALRARRSREVQQKLAYLHR